MSNIDLSTAMVETRSTAVYPDAMQGTALAQAYLGLGLAGEAGEVANQLKKILRDDDGELTGDRKAKLRSELGDVLWYWLRLCDELGVDPQDVMEGNLLHLQRRKAAGTIQGDRRGDGA